MSIFVIRTNDLDSAVVPGVAVPDKPLNAENGIGGKTVSTKKVVIDGPLSQLYTDTLNELYANEATMFATSLLADEQGERDKGDEAMYVYAVGDDDIDNPVAAAELFSKVSEDKTNTVAMLALCSDRTIVNEKRAIILTTAMKNGWVICDSMKKAATYTKGL